MYLGSFSLKFQDTFFPPENCSISTSQYVKQEKWFRLCERNIDEISETEHSENERKESKFCSILKFLAKNYPGLCSKLFPVYDKKYGLAICNLYINGAKE